mmetsp:Transcript_40202/g.100972  ORF Transcript_40202/g.100972 Transcript_40202/m.100972 type:complete len:388 (-) Transcript_40202:98-1261(-)
MGDVRYFIDGEPSAEDVFGSAGSAHSWTSMLGPTLQTAEGPKPTEDVLSGKKKVALLFADKNCPFCAAFEPLLVDTMAKLKAGDPTDTEVVYIPAEVESSAFRGVTAEQPFPAMPWETSQGSGGAPGLGFVRKKAREAGRPQGALGEKFGIASVPRLYVMDGKSGRILHDDKAFLQEHEDEASKEISFTFVEEMAPASWMEAKNFSWSKVLGPTLETAGGSQDTEAVLKGKKQVALFFADTKCPYCSAFEPLLVDTIGKLKASDPSDTEVVYIPAEVESSSFRGITAEQPFPSMPWATSQGEVGQRGLGFVRKKAREAGKTQGALGDQFEITAVPRVFVLDGVSGKVKYSGQKFLVEHEEGNKIWFEFDEEEAPPSWVASLRKPVVA